MFVSDDHAPYQHEAAYACRLAAIRLFKPDVLFLGGDHCDFYQISRFEKTPDRVHKLQDDLDETYGLISGYREAAGPRCRIVYLAGNHEERLDKFILRHAEALWSLRSLSIHNLLGLKQLKIKYVPGGVMAYEGVTFKHGNLVSGKSGYSAYREMDTWWRPGVSGHTHRAALIWRTTADAPAFWVESGCGCKTLDYVKGRPADWQLALSYFYRERRTGLWHPNVAVIRDGRTIIDGLDVSA
jgi:hypothetical protein